MANNKKYQITWTENKRGNTIFKTRFFPTYESLEKFRLTVLTQKPDFQQVIEIWENNN
jgi:hypothetical protein